MKDNVDAGVDIGQSAAAHIQYIYLIVSRFLISPYV